MAAIASFTLTIAVIGWLMAPIGSFLVNKHFSSLDFNISRKLHELKYKIIPSLEEILRNVTEQRMLGAAKDEGKGSESDLKKLGELEKDLKFVLYDMVDVMDLIEYRQIEKKVIGADGKSVSTSISSWVQLAIGDFIACCKRSSFGQKLWQCLGKKLWQYALDLDLKFWELHAKLQQYAQYLNQMFRDLAVRAKLVQCAQSLHQGQGEPGLPVTAALAAKFRDDIEQGRATPSTTPNAPSTSNPQTPNALPSSAGSTTEFQGVNHHGSAEEAPSDSLLHMICDWLFYGFSALRSFYLAARYLRDWSYEPVGIKNGDGTTMDRVLSITEIISLRKKIKNIEHIVSESNKSPLLNKSSSSTPKDADTESSSNCTVKNSAEESTSTQKEIDDVYRSIEKKVFGRDKDRELVSRMLRDGPSNPSAQKDSRSRILVTAQRKDAAAALGAEEQMQIPIPDLEDEQYFSMFMYYALEVNRVTSTDYGRYKAIGRKITKKLRRSPIAAITVGARLKSDNSIDFWERTSNLDVLNETMGALWWSYQLLGIDIRRCFAYCSIFPKAYRLRRDDLVRVWIAQGFVNTMSNETEELEDIGHSYFDQLLKFSFLQGQKTDFEDEFVEFAIHDLLHELAERVSGSEFYRIGLNGLPTNIPRGVHHLYIHTNNVAEIVEKILDMGNLRTLIISEERYPFGVEGMGNHDIENVLGRLFNRLRKVRVLILKLKYSYLSSKMSVLIPVSICQLKHLRYLCSVFYIDHLIFPSTFSKLYHIQVIDIRNLSDTSYPEDMANLICLRHIRSPMSRPILNIGRLTSLQELNTFEVKEGQGYGLKQLKHLNKLRGTLRIENLGIVRSKVEALEAHITQKERLSRLVLEFRNKWFGPDVEAEVLEGLCPPKDLQELLIKGYRGSRYPNWMLSRHHSETAPKHLQELVLLRCSRLATIPEDSELFIGLRKLHIFDCNWNRLPENMERLLSLQTLEIVWCHNMKVTRDNSAEMHGIG